MVSLLVDTASFLEAGDTARSAAQSVQRALSRATSGFAGSERMAGSDQNGLKWAASYDEACGKIFNYTAQLQDAVSTIARKLTVTAGYYELAELTNAGVADAAVSLPAPIVATSCPYIPSAAGGERKFPNTNPAYEWVEEQISNLIGDMWPDGDTAKLDHASTVWHRLADDLDDIASSMTHVTDALVGVDTPELGKIEDQVAAVKSFAKKLATACRAVGKACNDLSGKINYVHVQTEITLGITIAAVIATIAAAAALTPVTFGISDLAGAGGVAAEVGGAVTTITGFITELAATISAAVGDVVASTVGLVGISADLAATIGVTVGDITAGAVLWGAAGAVENTIVTAVTEPGSDLVGAAEEGFLSWGAGGAVGGILGKTVEIIGANGRATLTLAGSDAAAAAAKDADSLVGQPLSDADKAALFDYTGPGYWDINAGLREGTMTAETEARAQAVSDALAKLPDNPGTVFRGTHLTPEQIAKYQPGQTVADPAFTSTTTDMGQTFGGNVMFVIESVHGKDVTALSRIPTESETLFDKGTTFEVTANYFDADLNKQVIVMGEQ